MRVRISMAQIDPETLEALNALLQDERASVEVEVALSNGATERAEREMLTTIGGEEVALCCALREQLAATGAPVTRHVNGVVLTIISTERYDERLHAFAQHQLASGERSLQLSTLVSDYELRQLLEDIHDAHIRSSLWSEHRANQFASSRMAEFRTNSQPLGVGSFYGGTATPSFPPPSYSGDSGERPATGSADGSGLDGSNEPPDPYDSYNPYNPYTSPERDRPSREQNRSNDSYRSLATHETYPPDEE